MNNIWICGLLLFSFSAMANNEKVVYGNDDRKDLFESSNTLHKQLANSTAAMIDANALELEADDTYLIKAGTLEQDGVCSDARFAKQTTAAMCSGFLVGDQYLVTAGHCIQTPNDCRTYSWVFDYSNPNSEKTSYSVAKKDVYKCSSIVARKLDRSTNDDYALIKLDRKVEGRSPLKFRASGKIASNASLVVIGHPSGLPTKIADGAAVRSNSNKYYFVANLDTFGGNSGSAVFDTNTGTIEGILVRGERDYEQDSIMNCMRPKLCKDTECRGEDVTRITNIKELSSI